MRRSPSQWLGLLPLAALLLVTSCAGGEDGGGEASTEGTPAGTAASEAASGEWGPEVETLLEGAQDEEDALDLNWSGYTEVLPEVMTLFNEHYGLDIELRHTPAASSSDAAQRSVQEFDAGRPSHTDLLEAGPLRVEILNGMRGDSVIIEPVEWAELPNVVPDMVSHDNLAVAWYNFAPNLTYNTDTVAAEDVPETMADILELCDDYRIAGTSNTTHWDSIATDDFWGPDETIAYAEEFTECTSGLVNSRDVERIASGEFDILVLTHGDYRTKALIADGAPVASVIPLDFVARKAWYFALPKHTDVPNTATLFGDFLMSPAAQDVLYEQFRADSHFLENSQGKVELEQLLEETGEEVKTIDPAHIRRNADVILEIEEELDGILVGEEGG